MVPICSYVLWGYEAGERSSLGIAGRRCRWQSKAGRNHRSGRNSVKRKRAMNFGHRKAARSDNPEVVGSNPAPATMKKALAKASAFFNEINPSRDL